MGILGPPSYGIGATIRIGRDMLCLPYAGFFFLGMNDLIMSTKTIGLVGRGSGWPKVGIELGSCFLNPNASQPGMFQSFAIILVSVLLSAYIGRFSASRMQDCLRGLHAQATTVSKFFSYYGHCNL